MQAVLGQRLTDALSFKLETGVPRDVRLPPHESKAVVAVGVRRSGKTTWLRQHLAARLAAGCPREGLLMLSLEDDRLFGVGVDDLSWFLEEWFRRAPSVRRTGAGTLCLDEIQVVPGWERFVRRVLDTEKIEVLLSGSSAKLLSREVATSLRGRGVEVLIHPFSFREALRFAGMESVGDSAEHSLNRSEMDAALRSYLSVGGFPEAQLLNAFDRTHLLRGYVDVMVLRDVIDRHKVTNTAALLWLQKELLSNSGGQFSINKLTHVLKSQGIAVSKDRVHEYLDHLEDAFLVRTVWMHSASARQRMVNPRKVYPVDPGLIPVFDRTGRTSLGHALETVVMLHLERQGYDVEYVKTRNGFEVDFMATHPALPSLLVQVAATTSGSGTMAREVRALEDAMTEHPDVEAVLVTMDSDVPTVPLPEGARWQAASEWLLRKPGSDS